MNTIIGLALVIVGMIGLLSDWLGLAGKILFGGILALGCLYTVLLGYLAQLMVMILVLPFFLIGYVLFLPIKKKKGKVLREGNPVVAYAIRPDRIVLVCHYFIPEHMNSIDGGSVFRGGRKLAKMKQLLDEAGVPEVTIDEVALGQAVEVWNRDDQLRRKVEEGFDTTVRHDEPLIVLDSDSKDRLDRMHDVFDALWESERYREMRDEQFQLAVWYSLAVDRCYGREKKNFFDREFV